MTYGVLIIAMYDLHAELPTKAKSASNTRVATFIITLKGFTFSRHEPKTSHVGLHHKPHSYPGERSAIPI